MLGLAAIAIFCSYYESDAIGPIADLLGRQRRFTQSQIGDLTARHQPAQHSARVFNGLLIDRYGPARVTCGPPLSVCGRRTDGDRDTL